MFAPLDYGAFVQRDCLASFLAGAQVPNRLFANGPSFGRNLDSLVLSARSPSFSLLLSLLGILLCDLICCSLDTQLLTELPVSGILGNDSWSNCGIFTY